MGGTNPTNEGFRFYKRGYPAYKREVLTLQETVFYLQTGVPDLQEAIFYIQMEGPGLQEIKKDLQTRTSTLQVG